MKKVSATPRVLIEILLVTAILAIAAHIAISISFEMLIRFRKYPTDSQIVLFGDIVRARDVQKAIWSIHYAMFSLKTAATSVAAAALVGICGIGIFKLTATAPKKNQWFLRTCFLLSTIGAIGAWLTLFDWAGSISYISTGIGLAISFAGFGGSTSTRIVLGALFVTLTFTTLLTLGAKAAVSGISRRWTRRKENQEKHEAYQTMCGQ